MSAASKRRAERIFPAQAHALRQIAKSVKTFGLPSVTTNRAVERIRAIADEIDGRAETIEQPSKAGGVE